MNKLPIQRAALCAFVAACALQAPAAQLDTTADVVLGQANFTTVVLTSASSTTIGTPFNLGVDAISRRLFVADYANNRVLSWPSSAALKNGLAADLVLGQPSFTAVGTACSATRLHNPSGIAVDQFGNVYVADSENHRVVSFRPPLSSGMAATGVLGQANFTSCTANSGGTIQAGSLSSPNGLALDANGELYVADRGNNRVLRFAARAALAQGTPAAQQVFGQALFTSGLENQGNAAPTAATLRSPYNVAVDPAGNLWISDAGNNRVLRYNMEASSIDATADLVLGQADFVTRTAPATINASNLLDPIGLAIDAFGAVYVGDNARARILRFTTLANNAAATAVFGQSGSFTSGAGSTTADGLVSAPALALDAPGNLLVADHGNSRVLRFDVPLNHGTPALASISPESVQVGSDAFVLTANGSGFVAASTINWNGSARPTQYISGHRLLAQIPVADVASGGPFAVTVVTPAPGGGSSLPVNLALDARAPLDASADRVLGQPNFTATATNNPQVGEEQLGGVSTTALGAVGAYLSVDPLSGRLFVVDLGNTRILSWPSAAAYSNASAADLVLGQPDEYSKGCNTGGRSAATLCQTGPTAVDALGALYVADTGNNRVLQYVPPFSTGMAATRVFGQGGSFTAGICNNGGLTADSLCNPRGIAVSDSSLFVADGTNLRILVYDNPYGDFTADAVIGQTSFTSFVAAPVSATTVSGSIGMSVDRQGRLMVPDAGNNRVLRFSPPFTNGMPADLVIGQSDFVTAGSPAITASSVSSPIATAIDRTGSLLVTDSNWNRILRFSAPLTTGMAATGVIGQADFASDVLGAGRTNLARPRGLAIDPVGNVYVGDSQNARVVAFDRPFATPLPKSDTSGNGKSDFVWRASDGGFSVWDMNGGVLSSFSYGVVGAEWQVIATGDFNGDGKADLFWRRNDGATYLWFMNGTRPVGFVDTGVVPLDYTPVAVADFNGDGHADVMFRRSNGQNYMWLMVNGLITSQGFFTALPVEWVVQATGDLNGDGKADIVWRHTMTNDTYVWSMNGLTPLASGQVLPTLDGTWQIQGVADFDGDGKDDIQWRKSNGDNYLFEMNGSTVKAYVQQADTGPEWVIQGFGDFNADGKADIVYRNSNTGEVVIWLMQVNAPTSTPSLGNPGAIWTIAAPRR